MPDVSRNLAYQRASILDHGEGQLHLLYDGKVVAGVMMLPAEHDDGAGVHLIVANVFETLCSRDQVLRWASVLVNAN